MWKVAGGTRHPSLVTTAYKWKLVSIYTIYCNLDFICGIPPPPPLICFYANITRTMRFPHAILKKVFCQFLLFILNAWTQISYTLSHHCKCSILANINEIIITCPAGSLYWVPCTVWQYKEGEKDWSNRPTKLNIQIHWIGWGALKLRVNRAVRSGTCPRARGR